MPFAHASSMLRLPTLAAVAGLLLFACASASQPTTPRARPAVGTIDRAASRALIERTNAQRTQRGLQPLRRDARLDSIACRHSRDMLARNYMGHVSPDGVRPDDRGARFHRTLIGGFGENVWSLSGADLRGDALAAQAMRGWMNSPGHRANILSPDYTHLGACIVHQGRQSYRGTQFFARAAAYLADPLPYRWQPGAMQAVRVQPQGSRPAPTFYAFDDGGADKPMKYTFNDTLRAPQTPGTYRLELWFLSSRQGDYQYYDVAKGPRIRVR